MKILRRLLILAALAGAGLLIYWFGFHDGSDDESRLLVSGNIEVTDAEASFKIPGRIAERLVDEGETVQKGACIASLETADLEAEVSIRQAELLAVQSSLAELEAGSRPEEIEAARARLASAQADRDRLESDFRAGQKLLESTVIAEEEFIHRKSLFEAADARLREAGQQLKLIEQGPRKERIDEAKARVEQAKAALQLAETRLSYAKLLSPLSGVVLSKSAEPGEYVAPGTPVVTIGDLGKPWLRAYINERDLGRVKLGQSVRIKTDTYPDKRYEGTLTFIASEAEFTPKNVQTEEERVKLVYRVKIEVPNSHGELKPGMPADAEILLGPRARDSSGHGGN
ncbi:MAG: HlyD family secretion protein [Verrucomicrobiia bacterium]